MSFRISNNAFWEIMVMKKHSKQQLELLIYKLLHDILFLWLFGTACLLIAQNILPNYFFSEFSLAKIIFGLFAILFLIGFFGKRQDVSTSEDKEKAKKLSKTLVFLIIISSALIINSFRTLEIFPLIASSFFALLIFFAFFQITSKSQK